MYTLEDEACLCKWVHSRLFGPILTTNQYLGQHPIFYYAVKGDTLLNIAKMKYIKKKMPKSKLTSTILTD